MPRRLKSTTSLDTLRKEARRWLKAVGAGDRDAQDRLTRVIARAGRVPLRVVQQALAREYGFESWAALKRDRERHAPTVFASPEERVTAFIEHACVHYGVNRARGSGNQPAMSTRRSDGSMRRACSLAIPTW